jgi:hypothetical protein
MERSPDGKSCAVTLSIAICVLMLLSTAAGLAADTIASQGFDGPQSNSPLTPAQSLPGAPTLLSATAVSTSSVDLTWSNPLGELTDNTVYGYDGSSCSGNAAVADLGTMATSFEWNGLDAGLTFSFEVTASTSAGQGPPSNCANATTVNAPPFAPTGLTAITVSAYEVNLTWTNPLGMLTDDYVYLYSDSICSALLGSPDDIGSPVSSFDWGGLSPDTTYGFEVAASTAAGQGPLSDCATATTINAPPLAPADLTVSRDGPQSADLTWTSPSSMVTNVTVYAWDALVTAYCGNPAYLLSVSSTGTPVTNFEVTGLTNGTNYCYAVQEWNGTGSSALAWVNESFPQAPVNPTVTVYDTSANVTYSAPPGLVTGYTLALYETTGSWCSPAFHPVAYGYAAANQLFINMSSLSPFTSYCGLLFASNYSGNADNQHFNGYSCSPMACNEIMAQIALETGHLTPPTAPTELTADVISYSQVDLTWTNPSGIVTNNEVYLYLGSSCSPSGEEPYAIVSPTTTFDWGGLSPDMTYSFEVAASNVGGEGQISNCTNATTLTSGGEGPFRPLTALASLVSESASIASWPTSELTSGAVGDFTSAAPIPSGLPVSTATPANLGRELPTVLFSSTSG